MGKKHSYEYVRSCFEENGCQLLSKEYINNSTTMDYVCECGNTSKIVFSNFLSGRRCKKCGIRKSASERRPSYEEVKSTFEAENCKLLSKEYINGKTPLDYVCNCGRISKIRFDSFLKGHRCYECRNEKIGDKLRYSYDKIKQIFEDNGCKLLSKDYKNQHQQLDYICSCGDRNIITFNNFAKSQKCKKCATIKRADSFRRPYEEVKKIFEDNNCKLLSKTYINPRTPLDYICECGNISKIKLDYFLDGVRCKKCFIERNSGTNHWKYNPNLTDEDRADRRALLKNQEWRKKVYKRDDYTCHLCEQRGVKLNAHHLMAYHKYKKLRFDVNNGITLCSTCHRDFHKEYGNRNNTKDQFEEYKIKYGTICV